MFRCSISLAALGYLGRKTHLRFNKVVATSLFCGHLPATEQTNEAASQPHVATLPDMSLAEKNFIPSLLALNHAVQHEKPLSDNWLPHYGVLG